MNSEQSRELRGLLVDLVSAFESREKADAVHDELQAALRRTEAYKKEREAYAKFISLCKVMDDATENLKDFTRRHRQEIASSLIEDSQDLYLISVSLDGKKSDFSVSMLFLDKEGSADIRVHRLANLEV